MAEDRAAAEQAQRLRPLHRGLAVAADDLAGFDDALRDMHGEGQLAVARRGAAVAQQVGGAGVDLRRRHYSRQAAAIMSERLVNDRERRAETGAAALLVPAVMQL